MDSGDVTFTQPYLEQPIISASVTFDQDPAAAGSPDQQALDLFKAQAKTDAQNLMQSGFNYVIVNKSATGFTIVLNKPADKNINFSWVAIAVKGAKTFSSLDPAPAAPPTAAPAPSADVAPSGSGDSPPADAPPNPAPPADSTGDAGTTQPPS